MEVVANKTSCVWKLDRYARFLHDRSKPKEGKWKIFSEGVGELTMSITDTNQLVVSDDSAILESHNLVLAREWMKGLSRNNSLLIMSKSQLGATASAQHADLEEVTLGDMAKAILTGGNLPMAYHRSPLSPDVLPSVLRLCLADPAFPAVVEQVDEALKGIVERSA